MIDYFASFVNTNGLSFPDTLGVNATGGGATDGTEFVKLMVDDEWGARQAIMDHASLTPDLVTEAPGTAQIIDALKLGMLGQPAGSGITWWQKDDPATFGARVLLLTGQGILRANFVDLDNAVYVGDPDNPTASAFFRADNSDGTSRNIAGIYLIMPDLRGYTLRGLDTAASVDPDGASRDVGSVQADAMQKITGEWENTTTVGAIRTGLGGFANGVFKLGAANTSNITNAVGAADNVAFDNSGSTIPNAAKTNDVETRMTNIATRFGISY